MFGYDGLGTQNDLLTRQKSIASLKIQTIGLNSFLLACRIKGRLQKKGGSIRFAKIMNTK